MDQNQDNLKNQHLSDLMDDAFSDEAIEQLASSRAQKETWFRYNTVRAVLKDEHSAYSDFSFTESISAKIADETTYDLNTPLQDKPSTSNVVQLNAWQSWKRFTGGMAIAASVAFAMVLSVQLTETPIQDNQIQPTNFIADAPQASEEATYELTPADTAEQKKLEEIQRYLDYARQQSFGVNEQYVSDVRYKSFVVQVKDQSSELTLDEKEKNEENKDKKKENP